MSTDTSVDTRRQELKQRILALIGRCGAGREDDQGGDQSGDQGSIQRPLAAERDALLWELACWQAAHVPPYGRLWQGRGVALSSSTSARLPPPAPSDLSAVPALSTTVFRHARVAAHPPELDQRLFHSSGTTNATRSAHAFADLQLYEAAAFRAARQALFSAPQCLPLIILAPTAAAAPHSSLAFMFDRFPSWFGGAASTYVWHDDRLDMALLERSLHQAQRTAQPVALLGTSFAFVHAEDQWGGRRFTLPPGSLLLHTGGFKGRSREVAPQLLQRQLRERYGLAAADVRLEYGMTELSSQFYDRGFDPTSGDPRYWVPAWVRATVVDVATQAPLRRGTRGLLRIDDLANLDSCACLLTEDMATWTPQGLVIHGRAAHAGARGCSLSADQQLSRNGENSRGSM